MRSLFPTTLALVSVLALASAARAQLGLFSREQRIDYTREWQGERFDDGRPRVPDDILGRMKAVTAEEAWGVLRSAKFAGQFEGGWQVFNPGETRLVGRVVTAIFLPARPDVNAVVNDHGGKEGRIGAQNSWIIDILKPGDVLVADLFGEVNLIGDNLATSIYSKTGAGVVINGGVRDLSGISKIKGFTGYYRRATPEVIEGVMLMGINVPVRIGRTTIMPGDVVLGDPEGLVFVPPQLAEKVVTSAENIHLRDEWGHMVLRQGRYTPGQIDRQWTPQMEEEFRRWRETKTGGK
ncbi:MAG: RraA family protein [Bryobacterales bacterium]|nr:RraA family protein [Bryobacterales bacterium]